MKELIKQKAVPQYLSKITEVFDVVSKNVRTNYTMQDLIKHLGAIENIDATSIEAYELPGGSWYEDFGGGNGIWWYLNNEEKTRALINDVFLPRSAEDWAKQQAEAGNAENSADNQNK